MKSASICSVQREFTALISRVEQGEEIIITRHNQPIARLSPITPTDGPATNTTPRLRAYWRNRPLPPPVRSKLTHAELVAEGRATYEHDAS